MKPLLEAIGDGRPHQNKEIKEILIRVMGLSADDIKPLLPSARQTIFDNRYSWARTYLKWAGLLESVSRSIIAITSTGKEVLRDKPDVIDIRYLSRFKSFNACRTSSSCETDSATENASGEAEDTPQEELERAFRKIKENLADEILSEISKQTADFFERLVVDLLKKMGYGGSLPDAGIVTGKAGDEGIDGVVREDKLGFNLIYIQAKRWDLAKTVSRPEIQKFVGALAGQGATKGLFITTARFSKEARAYAEKQRATKVILVDGEHLADLMIEHNFGVSIVNAYEIKRVDTDFFADAAIS